MTAARLLLRVVLILCCIYLALRPAGLVDPASIVMPGHHDYIEMFRP